MPQELGSATRHTVALVMIVKNESRSLTRCLESVRPWVDEMVVLDTGSTDNTVALAQAQGARIAHFAWIDDFAAARNAALELAQADWRLILDADEWLIQGHEALLELRQRSPDFLGSIEVLSGFGDAGTQTAGSWLSRVLPRGARFEGRVHEQAVFDGPRRRLDVRAGHDGYLPAQMQAKGERNRLLLEQALVAQPSSAYLHYQLGKDHEVHRRHELACLSYRRALDLLGPQAGREPRWRHDLLLRTLYVLKVTGRIPEALELAQQEVPHWDDSPDFYFVLGDVLLDLAVAAPQRAGELLPRVKSAWERSLSIGENPNLEGSVNGRGSTLPRRQLEHLKRLFGI